MEPSGVGKLVFIENTMNKIDESASVENLC